MTKEDVRTYFLAKRGATVETPFREPVPVFKVGGKMFGLMNIHEEDRQSINLKYPKEKMGEIRSLFKEVQPGYHMAKDHWNTVYLDGDLDDNFIKELIDISYNLVFQSLTKKAQKQLNEAE
ncbi:MmcQ/YjbR family DNA-binding protein [Vallitalea okinawensis]|uniref:MmcQ/YjbR family DNA-binding protein n=1 Tax=Vallitalea okinawensis TaxID=2078660 RepID=UPI000CFCA232|nr:MmcQ/YjbR family DNA-binding protein [Vallitalea okinawensis]